MSNGNDVHFRPMEVRILAMLSDGLPHPREEVHSCLRDELSELKALQPHLTSIRKKIRPQGQDILCVLVNRRIMYRLVRLVASPNDGRS